MKKNKLAIIIISVIVVALLIIGVLFATGKLSSKNDNKETVENTNTESGIPNIPDKEPNSDEPSNTQGEPNTVESSNTQGETDTNQIINDTPTSSDVSFVWPTENDVIVRYYGERENEFGISSFHSGIDIAGSEGEPVYASASGTITSLTDYGNVSYGKSILINHNNGYYTLYAQLSSYADGLTEGMAVTSGQLIGYIGSTGWATGPHLHFEIRDCSEYSCAVDPMSFLNQ